MLVMKNIFSLSSIFALNNKNIKFLNINHKNFLYSAKLIFASNNFSSKNMSGENNSLIQNRNHIVWVDLEMSGLNIDTEHILEMAILITDKDLNVVAEGPEVIINQSDEVLDRMDDWCKKTHGESGLTEAVRQSKISITDAENMMINFVQKHVPKGSCPLAGNSIHVDRIFLNKYMKNFLNHLSYRIIDVSSIKELNKRWFPNRGDYKKRNAHRALDDIKESIEELKHYRTTIFKNE